MNLRMSRWTGNVNCDILSSDRESGRRPSSQLRRAWSVLLYIRPTKWPFFACLSGLLPTLAATPNSVYGAISARKIRSRKRHAKIPIGSEIMTVQKMPFWDLEHTSSSSSPPSSSPDSFFPRFLTYFHCSDLDQTWYTYSLQHSSGGYFAVFRNSPPPLPETPLLFLHTNLPIFNTLPVLRSSWNLLCLLLTTFPKRLFRRSPKFSIHHNTLSIQ